MFVKWGTIFFSLIFKCQKRISVSRGKTNSSSAFRRRGESGYCQRVIGHNLVDSLIYKQSLMKFLVFINNALQARERRRRRHPFIFTVLTHPLNSIPYKPTRYFHSPCHIYTHPHIHKTSTTIVTNLKESKKQA